jgi:signal transduction histidine kinase
MRRHDAPSSRWRALWPVWHMAAGFLFGFIILHPVAIATFNLFDPRRGLGWAALEPGLLLCPILSSFVPSLVPCRDGMVFGFFCAAMALINGYFRTRLARQRDQLARQAYLLGEKNQQLTNLDRTNRRQVQFMVHDFKGHLAAILGFAEHLLERRASSGPPAEIDALTRIRRQALRMTGAVMDLLEFARLREARTSRRDRASVSKLLETAAVDLSLPAHMGIVELGPGRWSFTEVTGDARIIQRVLVNLAFNALKHNPHGTRVVLDAHARLETGEVVFTCADNGRGLSPAALTSLFEEFGEREDANHDDSTGLGLAFCKAAVEAHGGRIWCESLEGRGATFTFTLPLWNKGEEDQCRRRLSNTSSLSMTTPTSQPI